MLPIWPAGLLAIPGGGEDEVGGVAGPLEVGAELAVVAVSFLP
jgi:hypothetical protein